MHLILTKRFCYDALKREDYQTLSRAQSFVKGTRIILFTR